MQSQLPYYPVEAILDRKLVEGKVYYLVKWKDFPLEESTWEQAKSLPYVRPLIRLYNAKTRMERGRMNSSLNVSAMLTQLYPCQSNTQEATSSQRSSISHPNVLANGPQTSSNLIRRELGESWRRLERELSLGSQKTPKEEKGRRKSIYTAATFPNIEESHYSMESNGTIDEQQIQPEKPQENAKQPRNKGVSRAVHLNNTNNEPSKGEKKTPEKRERVRVKRICMLKRVNGRGYEYLMEEEGGKLSISSGIQLMRRHPRELLSYFEGLARSGNITINFK